MKENLFNESKLSRRDFLKVAGGGFAGAALLGIAGCAGQQGQESEGQPVKVGILGPFSGPVAVYGKEFQRGTELYLDQKGGKIEGTPIEIVRRDVPGVDPPRAKQLAQELIVQEKVQFIGGGVFSPNALAIAPVVTEGKVPFLVFNAATASIPCESPYIVRTSFSQWQGPYTIAEWAANNGFKSAYVAVADYAPGHDALAAYEEAFTKKGGKIVGTVKLPLDTADFAPFVQRIKDAKPDAIFLMLPTGPVSTGFIKTYGSLGLRDQEIQLFGAGETDEMELSAVGNAALDAITSWHYSYTLDNPANEKFVAAYKEKYGEDAIPTFAAVAAYDGMHAIADVVAESGSDIDADEAMEILKGWEVESPRGSIQLDSETRDITQTQYIRRVERINGSLANVAFDRVPEVKDPWKELQGGCPDE